jgi:hypothetical protein
MVHYSWEKLKEAMKWRVGYVTYKEAVKNDKTTVVVGSEDDEPGQNALPPCPR